MGSACCMSNVTPEPKSRTVCILFQNKSCHEGYKCHQIHVHRNYWKLVCESDFFSPLKHLAEEGLPNGEGIWLFSRSQVTLVSCTARRGRPQHAKSWFPPRFLLVSICLSSEIALQLVYITKGSEVYFAERRTSGESLYKEVCTYFHKVWPQTFGLHLASLLSRMLATTDTTAIRLFCHMHFPHTVLLVFRSTLILEFGRSLWKCSGQPHRCVVHVWAHDLFMFQVVSIPERKPVATNTNAPVETALDSLLSTDATPDICLPLVQQVDAPFEAACGPLLPFPPPPTQLPEPRSYELQQRRAAKASLALEFCNLSLWCLSYEPSRNGECAKDKCQLRWVDRLCWTTTTKNFIMGFSETWGRVQLGPDAPWAGWWSQRRTTGKDEERESLLAFCRGPCCWRQRCWWPSSSPHPFPTLP